MLSALLMRRQVVRAARLAVLFAMTSACFGGGCGASGDGGEGCKDVQLSGAGNTTDTCTPAGGRCVSGWLFEGCAADDVVDETCPNPNGSIFGGGVCCRPSPASDGGVPSCAGVGGTCVPYAECPGHVLAPACAGPDVCCSTAVATDASVGSCAGASCEPGCRCRPLRDSADASAADAADAADAGPRFEGAGECACPARDDGGASDAGDGGDADARDADAGDADAGDADARDADAGDAGVYACGVLTCVEGCTCDDPARSVCVCP